MYEILTELIPELDSTDEYGTWAVDREYNGMAEDPVTMPYVSFGPVMREYDRRVYAYVETYPELGFSDYQGILGESDIEWSTESMEAADVSKLEGRTVVALLLAALRADRFCEGALLHFFESGAIRRWLMRLKSIDEETETA